VTKHYQMLLKQAREERGWSQKDVAEKIGTDSKTVSRWEPECGAIWTARMRGEMVSFPPHPQRTNRRAQAIPRWIRRGTTWTLSSTAG
jgi:DNA-binding XRE family transcriptional regulator